MRQPWRNYWISVVILATAAPLPAYLGRHQDTPLRRPLGELEYNIGDWQGRDQSLSERVRKLLGTKHVLLREYVDRSGNLVWLYVSYFSSQAQGKASHSPKNCLPGAGWQPVRAGRVAYPLAASGGQTINEILYEKEGRRQLVFYWFRERERIVASEYMVKWFLVWDAATRGRTDGALVRVSTLVGDSEAEARDRALAFMHTVLPRLGEFFPS